MIRRLAWCILVVFFASGLRAQTGSQGDAEGSIIENTQGDIDDVLADLAAAGSPLTQGEIEAMGSRKSHPCNQQILWRGAWGPDGFSPGSYKVDCIAHGLAIQVRRSKADQKNGGWRGSLRRRSRHYDLVAGGIAMAHGFGLLSGKPGRGAALTADQSLGWRRSGLYTWPYAPSGSALTGIGGAFKINGWQVSAMAGRWASNSGAPIALAHIFRMARNFGQNSSQIALLTVHSIGGTGYSLAGKYEGKIFDFETEMARNPSPVGGLESNAIIGWLTTHPLAPIRVEGSVGWQAGGGNPSLSAKPRLLTSHGGRGWALKISLQPQKKTSFKILVAKSYAGNTQISGRTQRGIIDLIWDWACASHWHTSMRWRCKRDDVDVWSQPYPWLVPARNTPQVVDAMAIKATRDFPRGHLQFGLRSLRKISASENGTRFLVTAQGAWRAQDHWWVAVQRDLAWGEDADLVSAISPLKGYLIPRHWGKWQEQWMAGVGRELGIWRFQAGMASREPASSQGGLSSILETWFEGSMHW